MGWKRKASHDPQQEHAKIPKRGSVNTSHFSHKLLKSSWRRKVSNPTKRKSWTSVHALSPGRQAHRFKRQEQKSGEGSGETSLMTQVTFISERDVCFSLSVSVDHVEHESDGVQSSPVSSPLQSEEDAELGLVITVGKSQN